MKLFLTMVGVIFSLVLTSCGEKSPEGKTSGSTEATQKEDKKIENSESETQSSTPEKAEEKKETEKTDEKEETATLNPGDEPVEVNPFNSFATETEEEASGESSPEKTSSGAETSETVAQTETSPETATQTGIAKESEKETMEETTEESMEEPKKIKGLEYSQITQGTGDIVKKGDMITVHYVGTLKDGTEFDSSRGRDQPFSFKIGEGMVIQGWELGFIGKKVGEKGVLTIAPELAYGDRAVGPIPSNSTLIFEIEILNTQSQ